MSVMPQQLAFDLPGRAAFRREDFFVTRANAQALAQLDAWRAWPQGKLLLTGPSGAGKTHLARMWVEETCGHLISARDLAGADLVLLAEDGHVAVEDAEDIAGDPDREEALFHLHNLLAHRGRLLLTASSPVRDWGLQLPDLISRIEAASLARIEAPDDQLLSAVLVKLFADRQTIVSPALIPWLVARMERSIDAARALVAAMDARALAEGRAITRATAKGIIDSAMLDTTWVH